MDVKKDFSLAGVLLEIWHALPKRRRLQYFGVLLVMLLSALMDVVSLSAVIPFLGILVNPEKVLEVKLIREIGTWLGFSGASDFILPFTFLFCAVALIAGAVRMLLLYGSSKLSSLSGADLGVKAYRKTLFQAYSVHVSKNSSEIISSITMVDAVVMIISQLLVLVSSSFSIIFITIALFIIDPVVAAIAAFGFGSSYFLLTMKFKKKLVENSKRIARERTLVLKAKQEGLGGIRDIIIDGTQDIFCKVYSEADKPLRNAIGSNIFLSGSPRFVMESLGMILIAVLSYMLAFKDGGISSAIPILGALALGAQRLLPALQQGYGALSTILGSYQSLYRFVDLLRLPMPKYLEVNEAQPFVKDIRVLNVHFGYSTREDEVLKDVSLTIRKGERIAVVGTTGSGKSTLVDVLMGLLRPTRGELLVDGVTIDERIAPRWQKNIAHVPQTIFLSDSTFAENIAFAVPRESIDYERVALVARQAQIAEYIESLPDKYQSQVGERGVRLSGGQRQRIGIARALYKNANVLVLDEATSALDNVTESALMSSIDNLDKELTIVLIAHRLSTIKYCDKVAVLEAGKIVGFGTVEQLEKECEAFHKLANQRPIEL